MPKAFVCAIDFEHEIEDSPVTLYPSKEALLAVHKCGEECGIYEVEINRVKVVEEPKW